MLGKVCLLGQLGTPDVTIQIHQQAWVHRHVTLALHTRGNVAVNTLPKSVDALGARQNVACSFFHLFDKLRFIVFHMKAADAVLLPAKAKTGLLS